MLIFVSFRPFDNTMTNVVYNLKLNCAWDLNPGLRMVGADKSTELWRPPRPLSAPPSSKFMLSLFLWPFRRFGASIFCSVSSLLFYVKKLFPCVGYKQELLSANRSLSVIKNPEKHLRISNTFIPLTDYK